MKAILSTPANSTFVDIAFLNVARSEDVIQYFWIEVISLNKYCNNLLFQSRDMTGNLIENGGYTERLQDLVPRLHAWEARLQRLQGMLP